MALASQSTRPQAVRNTSNFQSPRQKRQRNLVVGGVVVLLLVVGGAWAIWGRSGSSGGTGPKTPGTAGIDPSKTSDKPGTTPPATDDALTKLTTPPAAKPPEPVVLDMGKPKSEPAASGSATPPGQIDDPLARPTQPQSPQQTPPQTPEAQNPPNANPAPAIVPPTPAPAPADELPADAARLIDQAKRAMSENKMIEARTSLLGALRNDRVKETERVGLRSWISELNETIIFGPTVIPGDPYTESYKVVSGDVMERIARGKGLAVDWRLLARVNRMKDPSKLRIGQNLKLVKGPFHAVVHKGDFRVDIYAGTPLAPGSVGSPRADGSEEGWTYIRSFRAGLGSEGGTPLGTFVVKKSSKLVDPPWVNPKTGERFAAADPKNPIGEHWLGILGVDEAAKTKTGFGLHGTIEPDSIGKERSMGCVRMLPDDIAVVWELLAEEVSTVRIVP